VTKTERAAKTPEKKQGRGACGAPSRTRLATKRLHSQLLSIPLQLPAVIHIQPLHILLELPTGRLVAGLSVLFIAPGGSLLGV
jgi:hypothetical protein